MSKAFTALGILKLRDDGKISLDAPAEDLCRRRCAGWRYPTADSPRITRPRLCSSHASGFVTDNPWGDRQQVISDGRVHADAEGRRALHRAPGLAFEYSNFGYATLGRIITNVSGHALRSIYQRHDSPPLGMAFDGYEVRDWPLERRAIGYRWENDAWSEEPTMRHGRVRRHGRHADERDDYARWMTYLLSAWPGTRRCRCGSRSGRSTLRESWRRVRISRACASVTEARRPRRPSAYAMGLIAATDPELGIRSAMAADIPVTDRT
jgi:CubicO group peptidase (beta-lactamase class C family)